MINKLQTQAERLQSLLEAYPAAVAEYELSKHRKRVELNQAKQDGLIKMTEEAIRSESVMASAAQFTKLEQLKADIEAAKMWIAVYTTIINNKE